MPFVPHVFLVAAYLMYVAGVPQLDVTPSCRAGSEVDPTYGQSFKTCVQDELEARSELEKKWTSYRAAARSRCSAEVMIGSDPSYVELLECLEMDKSVSGGADNMDRIDPPGNSANAPQKSVQGR